MDEAKSAIARFVDAGKAIELQRNTRIKFDFLLNAGLSTLTRITKLSTHPFISADQRNKLSQLVAQLQKACDIALSSSQTADVIYDDQIEQPQISLPEMEGAYKLVNALADNAITILNTTILYTTQLESSLSESADQK